MANKPLQNGTRGNPRAKILIVGDCFSSSDNRVGLPFQGSSGKYLENALRSAGIDPEECYYTNVINKAPSQGSIKNFLIPHKTAKEKKLPAIRGLHPDISLLDGVKKLEELIAQIKPNVIVACGNYALWALTEDSFRVSNGNRQNNMLGYKIPTGINSYRGSQLRARYEFGERPLVPIFHPADVMRNPAYGPLVVHDLRVRVKKAMSLDVVKDYKKWEAPEWNFITAPTFDITMNTIYDLLSRAELHDQKLILSVDIETIKAMVGKSVTSFVECIGLAWTKFDAICIPLITMEGDEETRRDGYWSAAEEVEILLALKELLEHPNVEVVGQNFPYDFQYFIQYYFIAPNYKHDTMIAQHCVYPGTVLGLDHLSSMYCAYHRYWKEDGKEATNTNNDTERWVYNCRDCVVTLECIEELWGLIKHYKLEMNYSIQMVRVQSYIKMMVRGVRIDMKTKGEEKIRHIETVMEMEYQLEEMVPVSVLARNPKLAAWYRSNKQLAELFYEVLGQAKIFNRKTKSLTVDDQALESIGNREPLLKPLTSLLQQYRSMETFGDFLSMKVSPDFRIRTSYMPTTEAFRCRSKEDVFGNGRNLQNIPAGNE